MSRFIDTLKTAKENVINTVFIEDTISSTRFGICNSCEFFIKKANRCKKCGCFMSAKTKLKNAKCPIGKW